MDIEFSINEAFSVVTKAVEEGLGLYHSPNTCLGLFRKRMNDKLQRVVVKGKIL